MHIATHSLLKTTNNVIGFLEGSHEPGGLILVSQNNVNTLIYVEPTLSWPLCTALCFELLHTHK